MQRSPRDTAHAELITSLFVMYGAHHVCVCVKGCLHLPAAAAVAVMLLAAMHRLWRVEMHNACIYNKADTQCF